MALAWFCQSFEMALPSRQTPKCNSKRKQTKKQTLKRFAMWLLLVIPSFSCKDKFGITERILTELCQKKS
jgi:hypothetical protein